MTAQFANKVAVVTGGASGLGRTAALAFARAGAAVAVADITADAAAETVKLIERDGGRALAVVADMGDGKQVENLVRQTTAAYGRLDFLFNNAGISGFTEKLLADLDEELFDAVIRVNLKGVWLGMKHAIPAMLKNGGGCIVNTASTLGWVGLKNVGPYVASKHAVIGLTKTAAIEYGQQGIRVNAVCPGAVETPIQNKIRATMSADAWKQRIERLYPATGQLGRSEDIAGIVLFLCSDAASNIHGTAILADGGYIAQ